MMPRVLLKKGRFPCFNHMNFARFGIGDDHCAHQYSQHLVGAKNRTKAFRMAKPLPGGHPEHQLMDFIGRDINPIVDPPRRIIAPQAFRIIVPAIGNDFVAMLKDSALASTVALHEIVWRARNIGQKEFKTLQTFIIAAMIYWTLTIIFTAVQNRIESRLAAGDRNKAVKG